MNSLVTVGAASTIKLVDVVPSRCWLSRRTEPSPGSAARPSCDPEEWYRSTVADTVILSACVGGTDMAPEASVAGGALSSSNRADVGKPLTWVHLPRPTLAREHLRAGTLAQSSVPLVLDYPLTDVGSTVMYGQRLERERKARDDCVDEWCSTGRDVHVWLRSALGCRYEGGHIQSMLVGETVGRLLTLGCGSVILEENAAGLTPRWTETLMKTLAALGVPLSCVGLSLAANEEVSAAVVHCALQFGIQTFVGSSFPSAQVTSLPVWNAATQSYMTRLGDTRLRMDDLLSAVLSFKDQHDEPLTDEDLALLESCRRACSRFADGAATATRANDR